jgi:hypothetical protein
MASNNRAYIEDQIRRLQVSLSFMNATADKETARQIAAQIDELRRQLASMPE